MTRSPFPPGSSWGQEAPGWEISHAEFLSFLAAFFASHRTSVDGMSHGLALLVPLAAVMCKESIFVPP